MTQFATAVSLRTKLTFQVPDREPRSKKGKGGEARAMILTPERRTEIAKKAAAARWKKTG